MIKLQVLTKSKRKILNPLISQNNYKKEFETFKELPIFSTKILTKNNLHQKNKNIYCNNYSKTVLTSEKDGKTMNNNLNNQMKIINYTTEKFQKEKEIIHNTIDFNKGLKNQKSFYSIKEDYNNSTNIFSNKPIDIDKFIEEINSFLLPNDKTFEYIQNLTNDKIKMNIETQKIDAFSQLLKSKEIPVNTFNYQLIYRYVFNNTFKEAFKKALLNKTLINKDDIKEEYQKQINDIKLYLKSHNKEKTNLSNIQNFKSLIKNISPALRPYLNNNKLSFSRNSKILGLEKFERNRNIIRTNSSNNIFFNQEKHKIKLFDNKDINFNTKRIELDRKNNLATLYDNNALDKENTENIIPGIISKTKMDYIRESRLKNIIKKQKMIINSCMKLTKRIKNNEENLIKTGNSISPNIKVFDFFSDNNVINNKNEDIINYINNSEKSIKFEDSLIKDTFNISLSKKKSFDDKIIVSKNLLNDNIKSNNIQNKKLIKEKNFRIFNTNDGQIKKEEEGKKTERIKKDKIILNKKISLNKKNTLSIRSFKDFLKEEDDKPKIKELNNKVEVEKNFDNMNYTESLIKKIYNKNEEILQDKNYEYHFNNYNNNAKRLKNISREELIKNKFKFIKQS